VIKEPAVPGAQLVLELSAPQNASDLDDLEFFETLLTQYGALEQGESALTGITLPAATAGAAAAAGSSSQQAQVEVEPELVEIQGGEDLKASSCSSTRKPARCSASSRPLLKSRVPLSTRSGPTRRSSSTLDRS
jgi:hypothetical protein